MFKIKNVSKKFGEEYALRNISIEIGTGLNFIIGASGSGKTTLLKILSGMEEEFEGSVRFCGQKLIELTSKEKSVLWNKTFGFVWQDFNLLDEYTVLENVLLPQYIGQEVDEKLAMSILRKLKIGDLSKQKVSTLSGGQKQRVAIARELMKDPKVIFADEPTSALDPESANLIMDILRTISKKCTVIIVTHDTKLIDKHSKVYEFDKGEVVSAYVPVQTKMTIGKKSVASKLSLYNGFAVSFVNVKRQIGRCVVSMLAMTIAAILLLVSVSGVISNSSQEAFEKLFDTYGNTILDISIAQSFMSASGTGGEDDEPNADVTQNIDGLYEKYKKDPRVDYVLFAQALGDIKVQMEGKDVEVKNSNNMPVMNRLVEGKMPMGEENEVVVPESFVKQSGYNNKKIIGKTIEFSATVNNWESGELEVTPVNVNAKIVGVIKSDLITEYEGDGFAIPIEDSFFFSISALAQMREGAGMKSEPGNFYIRTKTPKDLISVKDELNANGIVPLGRFELVEDMVRLDEQTAEQAGTAVVVIGGLSFVIVLSVALLWAVLRRKEYAVFIVSGFSKGNLFAIMAAEHLLIGISTVILFLATSPVFNIMTSSVWNVQLTNKKLLFVGVLLTIGMSIISFVITGTIAVCTNTSKVLMKGEK